MKPALLSLYLLIALSSFGQKNLELLGSVKYDAIGNDVWGYTSAEGHEYALMGTYDGVSVVDITDPVNPSEIIYLSQDTTTWRDIKTWGDFAYVTSENKKDGILVIDLGGLPNAIQYANIYPTLPDGSETGACHNIYIDEFGFAYLAGCDPNRGGVQIFDLTQSAGSMVYVATVSEIYSHDVYARNNILYSSEIDKGVFAIYDVSDKSNIELLVDSPSPYNYTHNTWLSDDGMVLYTTDEKPSAPIGAYDISDLFNIKRLDEFRPLETVGSGVVPHNVHVWNDYLVISYYTDGCIIVDASRPDNLIEVGSYDTYFGSRLGFRGAWGAYPFFPSGNIIVGDIQQGLLILGANYQRAAHIEGNVYDGSTGSPINNARVEIADLSLMEYSKAKGQYKTGTVESGRYTLTVSKEGYYTKDSILNLVNGELILADFFLEPQPRVNVTGVVTDHSTGLPLADSEIAIFYKGLTYKYTTDAHGNFGVFNAFPGEIEIYAAKWGYKYLNVPELRFDGSEPNVKLELELEAGYEDFFALDLGWETSLTGNRGEWIRVKPIGTQPSIPVFVNPDTDSDDLGVRAYVTGQSTDLIAGSLLGATTLTSPAFDVTTMDEPTILLDYWLWTTTDSYSVTGIPLVFTLHNGVDSVVVEEIILEDLFGLAWNPLRRIVISDYIEPSADLRMSVSISSFESDDYTEAGVDNFRIVEKATLTAIETEPESLIGQLFPNPSSHQFNLYVPEKYKHISGLLEIYNTAGNRISQLQVAEDVGEISFGESLSAGLYYVKLAYENKPPVIFKAIKI